MLFMLHKMSEVRGWSHNEMMKMNKRVFYRYYGYWYIDRLKEAEEQRIQQRKNEIERNKRR